MLSFVLSDEKIEYQFGTRIVRASNHVSLADYGGKIIMFAFVLNSRNKVVMFRV